MPLKATLRAPRAVRWLRLALALSVAGPAVLFAALAIESRQAELLATSARLGRVAQIAQQHALRVVETNEVIYRAISAELHNPQTRCASAARPCMPACGS